MKANQVEMSGSAHVEPAAGMAASSGNLMPAGGATQQARIIESNDQHAILELTCSCGCKSRVQCNYGTT
jgi:hypothetical protein